MRPFRTLFQILCFASVLQISVMAQAESKSIEEPCGQSKVILDPLTDEAERLEFNVKHIEIVGSTYTRYREFAKRMLLNEGERPQYTGHVVERLQQTAGQKDRSERSALTISEAIEINEIEYRTRFQAEACEDAHEITRWHDNHISQSDDRNRSAPVLEMIFSFSAAIVKDDLLAEQLRDENGWSRREKE